MLTGCFELNVSSRMTAPFSIRQTTSLTSPTSCTFPAGVPTTAHLGQMLRARWTRWAVVGTPAGKVQDVGLVSEVVWRIENGAVIREETLSSKQPVSIRHWRLVV